MNLKIVRKCFILTFLLIFLIPEGYTGTWNNARDYQPIVMKGEEFTAFLGESIYHIFAFSYHAENGTWVQIPMQIDDKDDSTHIWVPGELRNRILNERDEIIFMAKDMGDQVPVPWEWIDNPESRLNERYEIVASDPNNPGVQKYVYFYLSSTLIDTATGYMAYTPAPPGNGADVIYGLSYVEGHNDGGVSDRWEITEAIGGNGADLLDRQKARGTGIALGIFYLDLTENDFIFVRIDTVTGKVRIGRRLWLSIYGLYSFDLPMYYYPYSVDNKGASGTIDPSFAVISHIRQSFDLNSNASGMMFFSNKNDSILIDGVSDEISDTLVFNPEVNWFLFTGDPGTILTLLQLNELGNTRLYFYDNQGGGTGDGKVDTGDNQSWGDTGILITGSAIEGRLSFSYLDYFLSPNQTPDIANEFVANFLNPLIIENNSQLVPVELSSFQASTFEGKVKLSWITTSESNNYGFEVQRKSGENENWEKIGFVAGKGTVSSPNYYYFTDTDIHASHYFYRLKQIDFDGSVEYSQEIEVSINLPEKFVLSQIYPNPFNATTRIVFSLPEGGEINATIFNLFGREVKTIYSGKMTGGQKSLTWDGTDKFGRTVSTGHYLVKINYRSEKGQAQTVTQKITLIK